MAKRQLLPLAYVDLLKNLHDDLRIRGSDRDD
jgi:hypothetical protein